MLNVKFKKKTISIKTLRAEVYTKKKLLNDNDDINIC